RSIRLNPAPSISSSPTTRRAGPSIWCRTRAFPPPELAYRRRPAECAGMTFPSASNRPDLRELLAFYADAGVDEPLSEEPINRFAELATKKQEPPPAAHP